MRKISKSYTTFLEKEPEKFEKEMQTSPEPPKTKGKTKKGKVKTFTDTHGMVPDIYVPAWKTNVDSNDCNFECGGENSNLVTFCSRGSWKMAGPSWIV